jgi:uncharacterized protein (TIGR00297 family)
MQVKGALILLLLIGVSLLISERAGKKGGLYALLSRKLLHITGVGSLAVAPLVVHNHLLLSCITACFSMLLFVAVKFKWFAADIYNRPSWGIALFPFSFLVLWLVLGKQNPALVVIPMLVLTFSDAAAAIAGSIWGEKRYNVSGDEKSFVGSMTFILVTVFCLFFLPSVPAFANLPGWNDPFALLGMGERLILALAIGITGALAEGSTSGGWDNVSVPLTVSWLVVVWPGKSFLFIGTLVGVMALLAIMAVLAFRKNWLDAGGAVSAWLLGLIIWTEGGWKAILLVGVFFITGSLLSKLKSKHNRSDAKKGKPRDYMQVLCNGGIAACCLVCANLFNLPEGEIYILYAVSVGVSTADTWSSELGVYFHGKVVDIVGFKPIPTGVSGGISWQGTLAGAAGAGLIAFLAHCVGWGFAWYIFLFGFAGMLLDSLLGSLFQAKYLIKGNFSDTPNLIGADFSVLLSEKTQLIEQINAGKIQEIAPVKGVKWITNDGVNLLSNLIITLLAGFFLLILWKGG